MQMSMTNFKKTDFREHLVARQPACTHYSNLSTTTITIRSEVSHVKNDRGYFLSGIAYSTPKINVTHYFYPISNA